MARHLPALLVLLFIASGVRAADKPFRYPEGKHGKGELKYRNGLPVLTAVGKPEEIGQQIGVLAVKPVARKLTDLVKGMVRQEIGPFWPVVAKACDGLFRNFPEAYRKEVEAMARAGGVEREILVVANTFADVQHLGGCSALVVEPSRSTTGALLFGRNFDQLPMGDLVQYGLIIVRRPAGKRAFVSVTFPGLLYCGSEMNDAGLSLAANDVRHAGDDSPPLNPKGTPVAVAGRRLMEECADLRDADKLLTGMKPTTSGSLIVCDGKGGMVYEITPNTQVKRGAEEGICACTNHFRTKQLATSTECARYAKLEKYRKQPKLGLEDVIAALREVHQGEKTMQSIVFEPAALRLHVALGPGAVAKQPLKLLECKPLFKGERIDR